MKSYYNTENVMFSWTFDGQFPVEAQVAGEEFERITRENGSLEAKKVVEESRREDAPLHPCFEWEDAVAAEKYRESQARDVIRSIKVTVVQQEAKEPQVVRAFVSTKENYQPLHVVLQNPDMKAQMLADAERDMAAFKRKYSILKGFDPVYETFNRVVRTMKADFAENQLTL